MHSFRRFFSNLKQDEKVSASVRRDYLYLFSRLLTATSYDLIKDICKHFCVIALNANETEEVIESLHFIDALIEVPHAYDDIVKRIVESSHNSPYFHEENNVTEESFFKRDFKVVIYDCVYFYEQLLVCSYRDRFYAHYPSRNLRNYPQLNVTLNMYLPNLIVYRPFGTKQNTTILLPHLHKKMTVTALDWWNTLTDNGPE